MKTATVRELRNSYTKVLAWVSSGQEVQVTQRGKIVARVLPPSPDPTVRVDWNESAAFSDAGFARKLTRKEVHTILEQSQGDF